jgi:hypothetical protein
VMAVVVQLAGESVYHYESLDDCHLLVHISQIVSCKAPDQCWNDRLSMID